MTRAMNQKPPAPAALQSLHDILARFPRAPLAHTPTPLEKLSRLSDDFTPHALYVKRDDCTGLAMGGNKARQLEFYLGEALERGCDCVLSTGAVQSNAMRTLAAGAAKLGMECHVQLEARVNSPSDDYLHSGNVLLDRLFGARVHHYAVGEDEDGADHALAARADALTAAGRKPYIIPLGAEHAPTGALGYVRAAGELAQQIARGAPPIDLIVVGSGSGLTHAGLLTGLALLGVRIPVLGVCVRRDADQQRRRVIARCRHLADILEVSGTVEESAVRVDDSALAPGYGCASAQVVRDIRRLATREGLLTDPAYSGKTFSAVFHLIDSGQLGRFRHIAVIHTGGTPALFGYRREVLDG